METQVKERLTGAVILVALVVLLVPELLTGPGPTSAAPPLPAEEPAMRSYTIDLVDGGVRRDAAPAPTAMAQPVKPAEGAPASQSKGPAAQPAEDSNGLEASVIKAEEPVVAPAPAQLAPPPTAEKRAAAGSEGGAWAVQVGSFASRENARRLAKELSGKGYAAFVLEGGGTSGKLYRVRVGPEPDRQAATELAARLRTAGKPGSVVSHP